MSGGIPKRVKNARLYIPESGGGCKKAGLAPLTNIPNSVARYIKIRCVNTLGTGSGSGSDPDTCTKITNISILDLINVTGGPPTYTLTANTTIDKCNKLTITNGQTLIVPNGITLTINGSVEIKSGGFFYASSGGEIINNSVNTIIILSGGYFYATGLNSKITNKGSINTAGFFYAFDTGKIINDSSGTIITQTGGSFFTDGSGSTITNYNIIDISGGFFSAVSGGEIINNLGKTINIKSGGQIFASGTNSKITNNGTMKVFNSGTTAYSVYSGIFLNNSSGTIYVYDNGTLQQDLGSLFTNNGTIYGGGTLCGSGYIINITASPGTINPGCPPP